MKFSRRKESLISYETLTISLLVATVLGLPKLVIDVFSLPIPFYIYGITVSHFLLLPLFYLIVRLSHKQSLSKLLRYCGVPFVFFLSSLWFVDVANYKGFTSFSVTLEFLLFCVLILASSQLSREKTAPKNLFQDLVFIYSVTLLSVLFLDVFSLLGLTFSFLNYSELVGRNSLIFIGCTIIWVQFFCKHHELRISKTSTAVLFILTLACALMGSSKFSILVLVLSFIMKMVHLIYNNRLIVNLTASSVVLFSIFISFFSNQLVYLSRSLGMFFGLIGDDLTSLQSKVFTNIILVDLFEENLVFGVGWSGVAKVQYAGFIGHNLLTNLLLSYGLAGLISISIIFWFVFRKSELSKTDVLQLLAVFLLNAVYINDIPLVFSVFLGSVLYLKGGRHNA